MKKTQSILTFFLFFTLTVVSRADFIPRSFEIYPATGAGAREVAKVPDFFGKLGKGAFLKYGNFIFRTTVALKKEKRRSAYDILELESGPILIPHRRPSDADRGDDKTGFGWSRVGQGFVWKPGVNAEPLPVPFGVPSGESRGRVLTDYDELWVDYRELFPAHPCAFSVKIGEDSADSEGEKILSVVDEIDASEAVWVAKDSGYILRRLLRLSPDAKWRYVLWRGINVIQRRLHRDLSDIEAMDVVFASGFSVKGLNLRIETGDNDGPGKLVELAPPNEMLADSYGNQVWRVNMTQVVRERFPGVKKVYLQEIIAFAENEAGDIFHIHPLKKIIFQGMVDARNGGASRRESEEGSAVAPSVSSGKVSGHKVPDAVFSVRTETVTPFVKRMIVSLDVLKQREDVLFRNGRLSVLPGNSAEPSGIKIEKIWLVSGYDTNLPAFLRSGEDLIRNWAGPFINPPDPEVRVEWPEVLGYLPFGVLRPRFVPGSTVGDDSSVAGSVTDVAIPIKETPAYLPPLKFKTVPFTLDSDRAEGGEMGIGLRERAPLFPSGMRESFMKERGISFRSDRPFTKAARDGNGLILEGDGRLIEVGWTISAVVDKGAIFFLAVPEGAEKIRKIILTASFEKGADLRLIIGPNMPVPLVREGRILNLSFRIDTTSAPFHLKLKEATLFRPVLTTKEEAFVRGLPEKGAEIPPPVALWASPGIFVYKDGGRVRGAVYTPESSRQDPVGGALHWSTPLVSPMEWAGDVRLHYRIPQRTVSENPCWLNLKLKWDKRSESRDVCLERAEGDIMLPLADFLGKGGEDPGALNSADWKIDFGSLVAGADNSFEFGVAFEGYSLKSASRKLKKWAVLYSRGLPIGFTVDKEIENKILEGPVQLEAEAEAVSKVALSGGEVTPAESPWFKVDSAAIEPVSPLPQGAWKKLVLQKREAASSLGLFSWLVKVALLLAFAGLLWKGFYGKPWAGFGSVLKVSALIRLRAFFF